MAQTRRTLAQIWSLLADNTSEAISPTDHRDGLYTLLTMAAAYYFDTPAQTSISGSGTPTLVSGATTALYTGDDWTISATNRATYTGTPTMLVVAVSAVSMTAAASSKDTSWYFAKSGVAITGSRSQRKIGTGTDVGSTIVVGITTVTTGQYIELFCANDSDTVNLTAEADTPVAVFGFIVA